MAYFMSLRCAIYSSPQVSSHVKACYRNSSK